MAPGITKDDYREILRDELELRLQQNPSYSLRAFARDVDTAPSRISEVINARRGLSAEAAERIARRLGFGEADRALFVLLVEREHARSPARRQVAGEKADAILEQRRATPRSERTRTEVAWYHAALVEASRLVGYRSDSTWLASRLGIKAFQVENAYRRLLRMGFARRLRGKLVATKQARPSVSGLPERLFALDLDGVDARARQARRTQPADGRHSAVVFAFGERELEQARERVAELEQELARLAAKSRRPNTIYCLSTQLFRVDQR